MNRLQTVSAWGLAMVVMGAGSGQFTRAQQALISGTQQAATTGFHSPQELVRAMIRNEAAAEDKHDRYEYIANERSGRTGGHLWTELVVETAPGRVRRLLAVDGRPLTQQQADAERSRLAAIAADPQPFIHHEQTARAEEKRARELLDVLAKDFIFSNVVLSDGRWSLDFAPDPACQPSGIEERILHNMTGHLVIDAQALRLIHMDFHLLRDVGIGFGLLADVHTGTTFISDRSVIDGRWHTTRVTTQVHAKAVLIKNINLTVDLARWDFKPVPSDMTVPQAVTLLENTVPPQSLATR